MKYWWPLLYVAALHAIGLYLFSRGFLLSRLALPSISSCPNRNCTLFPTHTRAVVLIIDALRFDFIAANPPEPRSEFHHDVLSLPRELSAKYPQRSFIFDAYADAPTTTLQRIKALVTGSLPTFVDAGHNFGGAAIAEDSLIHQHIAYNRSLAFTGDDTWLGVFPDAFEYARGYDSFNVEDLHTVDDGVTNDLFPLLAAPTSWRLLVGHFLGVDHVGHRLGPDHPQMRAKLQQMNDVLARVVEALPKNTLLVVLGDHGMDRRGDHGGDGALETSAALWIYSTTSISAGANYVFPELKAGATFPGAPMPARRVQQIDILPTLALLLGLPIPFNNLGTAIPELFWRDRDGSEYAAALALNAAQIANYLAAYRASPAGGELDAVWGDLAAAHARAVAEPNPRAKVAAQLEYTRLALASCRALWAQFNAPLIALGLAVLAGALAAGSALYSAAGKTDAYYAAASAGLPPRLLAGAGAGALACLGPWAVGTLVGVSAAQHALFGAAVGSMFTLLGVLRPRVRPTWALIPLALHAGAFLSNSYILWEDRGALYLLITSLVPSVAAGLRAPGRAHRTRILSLCVGIALCARLLGSSTVCREEQHPWCSPTFGHAGLFGWPALALSPLLALFLPWALRKRLALAKADQGPTAGVILRFVLPGAMLAGSAHWLLEAADGAGHVPAEWTGTARTARTVLAHGALYALLALGGTLWALAPGALRITSERVPPAQGAPADAKPSTRVIVLGFGNALGAGAAPLPALALGAAWLFVPPAGQLALGLTAAAALMLVELADATRDARALSEAFEADPARALALLQDPARHPTPAGARLADVVPLALLAQLAFFGTGHQAVLGALHWKAAFVLARAVSYPAAPVGVVANTLGAVLVCALAAPVLGVWGVPPVDMPGEDAKEGAKPATRIPPARRAALRAGLALALYFGALLTGAALAAGLLRRHLMVWKVFAPRFMLAGAMLGAVDVGVLVGVLGVGWVARDVGRVFGVES